jgi:protein phosphatase
MNPLYFSAKGPRSANEDSYLVQYIEHGGLLLIVADGLGGHKGGKYASKYATKAFYQKFSNLDDISISNLEKITHEIHEELKVLGQEDPELYGMATTLTATYIDSEFNLIGIHTGDSRAYLLRNQGIVQLTVDHTEAQKLFDEGLLTKEELYNYPRKNIIFSALGSRSSELVTDSFEITLEDQDRLLLSSDGFYSAITKKMIRDFSLEYGEFSEFFFEALFFVRNAEPTDNYSIVGVEISTKDSNSP